MVVTKEARILIVDADDDVLSMPPIINGELTKLTLDTRNLLIDVTGTDLQAVTQTLIILATSFAEAGGRIGTMEMAYPDRTMILPDLTPAAQPTPGASPAWGFRSLPLPIIALCAHRPIPKPWPRPGLIPAAALLRPTAAPWV